MSTNPEALPRTPLPWWGVAAAGVRVHTRPLPIALFYLALFTLSEIITVLVNPSTGQALYLLILFALILHTTITWGLPFGKFTLSLAFVPLIRVISLSLPMAGIPLVFWYLIVSIPLYAAAIVALKLLNIPVRIGALKGRGVVVQLAFGLTGIVFGYIEYLILQPEPLVLSYTWERLLLAAAILLVSTGLLEEIIFRGIMQGTSIQQLGRVRGIIYVALIFAVLHIGYNSLPDIIFVLIIGLLFGWFVARTGSLLGVTLSHSLTNIVLFLVIPYWIFSGGGEGFTKVGEMLPAGLFSRTFPTELVEKFEAAFLVSWDGRGDRLPAVMDPLPPPVLTITRSEPTPAAEATSQGLSEAAIDTIKTSSSVAARSPTVSPSVSNEGSGDNQAWFCQAVPAGWSGYTVSWGDTLSQLAYSLGTTIQQIVQVNCFDGGVFYAGLQIHLPPAAANSYSQGLTPYTKASWYITAPAAGSTISGSTTIMGTADFPPDKVAGYRLEVSSINSLDQQWRPLGQISAASRINEELGILNADEFFPGDYFLRLVLVSIDGSAINQPFSIKLKIK